MKQVVASGESSGRRGWRAARLVVYAAFWWLVVVWIAAPEQPSRLYRNGVYVALGAVAVLLAWPRSRRALALALDRAPRWADLLSVNSIAVLVVAELGIAALSLFVASPLLVPGDARAQAKIQTNRYPPRGIHNARQCNALGFFDTEFELQRRPGVRRIAALADSFGPGVVAYERNFLTRLDELLDRGGAETEVLNFGVIAVGPVEYLHLWRTEVQAYRPDLVLVCFFIGNDFVRRRSHSLMHASSLRSVELVRRMWRSKEWLAGSAPDHGLMDPEAPTMSEADYLKVQRDRVEVCRVDLNPRMRQRYGETFEVLDQMCAEVGDRLRVVLIPDEFQVDDARWAELVGDSAAAFDREQPNTRLRAFFGERSVPCLDLLEPMRAAHRGGVTYKPRDTHWNARGNEAAAAALASWLAQ